MTTNRPALFCHDGSEGASAALAVGGDLVVGADGHIVVLSVWRLVAAQLAAAETFGSASLPDEADADRAAVEAATRTAEDGVARASARGFAATARVELAGDAVWRTILAVAMEIDAAVIVCGRHGRSRLGSALMGSVSREVLAHAGRPVLLVPEP